MFCTLFEPRGFPQFSFFLGFKPPTLSSSPRTPIASEYSRSAMCSLVTRWTHGPQPKSVDNHRGILTTNHKRVQARRAPNSWSWPRHQWTWNRQPRLLFVVSFETCGLSYNLPFLSFLIGWVLCGLRKKWQWGMECYLAQITSGSAVIIIIAPLQVNREEKSQFRLKIWCSLQTSAFTHYL